MTTKKNSLQDYLNTFISRSEKREIGNKVKRKSHSKTFLELKANNGLPAKSYIYIMHIDSLILNFLSYACKSPHFDMYITNLLTHHFRYKDRLQSSINYVHFMTEDSPLRLSYIYPTKLFRRSSAISLLNYLYNCCIMYNNIKDRFLSGEYVSDEDKKFFYLFSSRWITSEYFIDQITVSYIEVRNIIHRIYTNFSSFLIKNLMSNRHGASPSELYTDAYNIIVSILDVFDTRRSKVPFNTIFQFYTKNRKNLLIQEEKWNTPKDTNIVFISDDESDEDCYTTFKQEIENSLQMNYDNKSQLLDIICNRLPDPIRNLVNISYGIVNPLSQKEELDLLFHK